MAEMSQTPDEPRNLNNHDRLREQVDNLVTQVWIDGQKGKDGQGRYVDQVLHRCAEEVVKILPEEHHEAVRDLFEKNS